MISQDDLAALKAYVQGPSGQNVAESTVMMNVSHSNLRMTKFFEIRLDKHMTIEAVKVKLSFHCGTNASSMMLQLLDESGTCIAHMNDDSKLLGFYSPNHGYCIHIIDTDPTSASVGGWLEDTSLVEKYKMSDEDYNKRENTYRKYKEQKLKEDPEWTLEKEMAKKRGIEYVPPAPRITDTEFLKDEAASISVGQRCSVEPGDRRGEVKFVGNNLDGLPLGYWIGVCYDEPLGKNDGSVKGKKYFDAPLGYGAFVRPDKVKVGDYPVIDEFASDLDDDDEI